MKTFKKKATKPENTKWFKVGETYVGKCIMREFPMEVYISTKGVWKKTYSYIAQDRIAMRIADRYGMTREYKIARRHHLTPLEALEDWDLIMPEERELFKN